MKLNIMLIFVLSLSLVACSNVDSMTIQEKEIAMQEMMVKEPPKEMSQTERAVEHKMAKIMETGNSLKTGIFEGRAHPTSGEIKIVEKDGKTLIVFSDDFKSDSGPELHVVLSENANPKNSRDLHQGEVLDLGILKSTTGAQTYVIPPDMVGLFNSVSIYCKPFKVLFGLANLK